MKTILLNKLQIENKITRLAHQIIENNFDESEIVLVGLNKRGEILSGKIYEILKQNYSGSLMLIGLQVLKHEKQFEYICSINLEELNVSTKNIIIIDDVVDSGHTIIYAVAELLKHRPKQLETLALIDRNHRKYPVKVNYIGLQLATTLSENVVVEFDIENPIAYLE